MYYGGTAKGYLTAGSGTGAISLNTQGDGTITNNVNGTARATITSTGLAVNGALSATGQLSGKGTATNDNAAAGYIGEYVESVVASASAVSLTTATAANVTSISLTAGDWDVYPIVNFTNGATTVLSLLVGWVSTTSATIPSSDLATRSDLDGGNMVPHRTKRTITPPSIRISLSATTTVYLEAYGEFSVSTLTAFGAIRARRVR